MKNRYVYVVKDVDYNIILLITKKIVNILVKVLEETKVLVSGDENESIFLFILFHTINVNNRIIKSCDNIIRITDFSI